jgi:ABC-type glycerol-3-phosphate transport system permease component
MTTTDWRQSIKRQTFVGKTVAYVLLFICGLPFIVPLLFVISTALKSASQVFVNPPIWVPMPPQFGNFIQAWNVAPFGRFLVNSLITTFIPMIGDVFVSAVVAYSFARLRWPGRDAVFSVLLVTMIMPGIVTFIPTFIVFANLGWVNTFLPFIVPAFFGGAFYIFLLRQFMLNLPDGLEEAARIDGAGTAQIFIRIVLPLLGPALATVAIFSFMARWNDFFGPMIYLHRPNLKTLMLGLAFFESMATGTGGSYGFLSARLHLLMSITTLIALPCVLIFILFQKYFVRDVITSGFKL